ncbi:tetratricopeptide repeat protein [Streptomyces iconiensis]|uniref:Tetratricopeptide repeat protein n=1 Tax=Streptomyces iconiensis TaxID=1384038 RepID=A0ABT7A285_9ACTN|nr:tetratricopeptide repeat protein [Streptomyces iconiensis]MDJ1135453.1 tetratricopeptide repeat protein [Streptomyces iconiensis]
MTERLTERLLMDLLPDGQVSLQHWPSGEFPSAVGALTPLEWPLKDAELEELRWYLEKYLQAPFGVYGERGPRTAARLPEWGAQIFDAAFSTGSAREAWVRARARAEAPGGGPVEIVVRSISADLLGLPWELMAEPGRPAPLVLDGAAITRSLPAADLRQVFGVAGSRLRVLMVISRPQGTADVSYRMIARPLLQRLEAVRGQVELVVLRPPTLEHLEQVLRAAQEAGEPFQIVHFDGHGVFGRLSDRSGSIGWGQTASHRDGQQGMLAFEDPAGGTDWVAADRVARVLAVAQVPVVVLNACQSATVGSRIEAAVATRLLQGGTAAVVAMAYSVYTVAAAEFMTAFYERLFAGDRLAEAVTAGRYRLARADRRPSPKGQLPLADWMIPVLYARGDVQFPGLHTARGDREPVGDLLDRMRRRADGAARPRDVAAASDDGLPARVGEFVGRDAPLYLLDVAARRQRVVVLHGPGGTGKTELAKTFGRWYRDTGAVDDPSWVIWHSFEPGVASFGVDGMIDAIGQRVWGDRFARLDRDERRSATEELLASKRLLLIWDNFESVHTMPDPHQATPPLDEEERTEHRQFLRRIAGGGRSMVVITSRTTEDWLGGPDVVGRVTVGGLEPEEANEYADQLLAPYPNARRRRESVAFGELVQWLDGHPLSMRLTLPHLQTTSAQKLLAGLRGTAPLPTGGAGDGGRTGSLAACVAYSFTHLHPDDQKALSVLGLIDDVTSNWVLAAFSAVPGVPEQYRNRTADQWAAVLDRAAGVGLLTSLGAGMYRIHPALPAYLARLLPDSTAGRPDPGEEPTATLHALLEAHATFSLVLAKQIDDGQDTEGALAIIDHKRRTLGSLLGYALEHRLWYSASGIIALLIMYWDARGLAGEARVWLDRALTVVEPPEGTAFDASNPPAALWLFLTNAEAVRLARTGRLEQSERAHRTVLRILEQQPTSPAVQADLPAVYLNLGNVARMRGDQGQAEDWYHKSLALQKALDNRPGLAATYHQLARVNQDRGELDRAEDWYRKSLDLSKKLGNRAGSAQCYYGLGIVARLRGDLDQAEGWYRKSLALQKPLDNRPGLANTYQGLAIVARLRGEPDRAEEWYRQSLLIYEELDDRHGRAATYHQLGILDQDRGELGRAERWYHKSLEFQKSLDNRRGLADTYHQLGILDQDRGELGRAEDWYNKTLAAREPLDDHPGLALTYAQLGLLAEEQGRPAEALRWTVSCVALFDQVPHPLTGTGPEHLKRMARDLGMDTVVQVWPEVTGQELPAPVREYLCADPPADV